MKCLKIGQPLVHLQPKNHFKIAIFKVGKKVQMSENVVNVLADIPKWMVNVKPIHRQAVMV